VRRTEVTAAEVLEAVIARIEARNPAINAVVTTMYDQARKAVAAGLPGSPTSAEDERRLVFDPANRTDGIELSNDPVLLARSEAYSISYQERSRRA
jgi:hypothetical protein